MTNDLKNARNIGPTVERHLNQIGVFSLSDLAEIGPVEAYKRIGELQPGKTFPVCYYLYSLQGALLDVHWNDLPGNIKEDLKNRIK